MSISLCPVRTYRSSSAIRVAYIEVKLTDLFGWVIPTDYPKFSNDGRDSFVSFAGHDLSAAFFVDENGQTLLSAPDMIRNRIYRINFGDLNIDDVAGLIIAGASEFSIADMELIPLIKRHAVAYDWSPDGQSLVYTNYDVLNVWDVRSGVSTVILNETNTFRPNWSSANNKIIFNREMPGVAEKGIYTINPDGTDLTPLLISSWNLALSTTFWAPDGSSFVYKATSNRKKRNLFVSPYPVDGSSPVSLTGDTDPAISKYPLAWVSNNTP